MRVLRFFLLVLCGVACASAQDPNFSISLDARNVSVNVNVVDAAGRPVTKLTRDDFQIYEDGVRQEIQTFESVEIPYNILMLVDCSGSTEADQKLMGEAIDRFAAKLRSQDKIAVSQFGSGVETLMEWQPRTRDSLGVIIHANSRICAGTDFYDALQIALTRFKGINGRKGVVVLTDGVQVPFPMQNMTVGGRRLTRVRNADDDVDFQKMLKAVAKSDVVFYFVAVNTDLNPDPVRRTYGAPGTFDSGAAAYDPSLIYNMQQARSRMQQVADTTGGRVVFPRKPSDVAGLYEEIARDFGTYYGLWYSPLKSADSAEKKERRIEVRVRTPGLVVKQSRDTYVPLAR